MPYTYITVLENGKQYIGWTARPYETADIDGYFGSPSYKGENWKPVYKVILGMFDTNEEAKLDEVYWHKFFDVKADDAFYNLSNATSAGFSRKSYSFSAHARHKMSLAKKGKPGFFAGKKHNEVSKQKMRERKLGKKHTAETKAKVSATHKMNKKNAGKNNHMFGKTGSKHHKSVQRILYNEKHGVYFIHGLAEFARLFDLCKSAIGCVSLGKRKTAYKGWILAVEGVHFCPLK